MAAVPGPRTRRARAGAPSAESGRTRERLLAAAEELFAANGIHATSLRDITARAGANIASVNYHFASKSALTQEVFRRHLGPLNQERLLRLAEAERAAGVRAPALEDLLRAFFDPTVALWEEHPDFIRLLGRLQFEPDQDLHRFYLSQFDEVFDRFKPAFERALPDLPLQDLFWRMYFVIGAMFYTWTCHPDLYHVSGGLCTAKPYPTTVDRLIEFGAAGLRAVRSRRGESGGSRRRP